jgi:glycosyltransferase involved in cell wall biosynthesis
VKAAKRRKAKLYLAHLVAALPAAAIAAQHHGARYAFDAEDFHLGDLPDAPEHADATRMVRLIEERYLPACAYVTAASPGIADAYAKAYGIRRPTVVLNTFPRARAPRTWSPAGTASPAPSVYWFSQTIGTGRGIECAVKAIARSAACPHLYLRGAMANGFGPVLRALSLSEGVADRVHILPSAPPRDMEKLAAAYDVGLSGEAGLTPNNRIALGNKLFSYLLAGLPILLSGSPAHRSFATELGEAAQLFPIDDPVALAGAMDAWLLDPRALARARQAAWTLGQRQFNWEIESEKLVRIVASSLRPAADGSATRARGGNELAATR